MRKGSRNNTGRVKGHRSLPEEPHWASDQRQFECKINDAIKSETGEPTVIYRIKLKISEEQVTYRVWKHFPTTQH